MPLVNSDAEAFDVCGNGRQRLSQSGRFDAQHHNSAKSMERQHHRASLDDGGMRRPINRYGLASARPDGRPCPALCDVAVARIARNSPIGDHDYSCRRSPWHAAADPFRGFSATCASAYLSLAANPSQHTFSVWRSHSGGHRALVQFSVRS